MTVKIFENENIVGREAADAIIKQINEKPRCVIGLATGSSPLFAYRELIRAQKEGRVSFREVKTFNLDEYVGLASEHRQSYRFFMNENLFSHIDIDISNTFFPGEGAEPSEYDGKIKAAGGIDLQLLGIGNNGHIAFNEPGTPADSLTHKQKISESTRRANARFFGGDADKVPEYAVTLGLLGIMNARKIILVACGEAKAKAVHDMIRGRVDANVPASILQLHPDCTVLLDRAAAGLL